MQLVLSLVLDGLDDLYDQRFGAPIGSDPVTRAEVCLLRVLVPSGIALAGSHWGLDCWESQMRSEPSFTRVFRETI